MTETKPGRAHLITGGFPPGSMAGHDHDYARLRLLGLLAERDVPTSVANDFADVEKWLPVSHVLITYVAGPYPDAAQTRAIERWLEAGGHWLALHGTSGGRAERVEGIRQRRTVKTEHHALLGSYFLTHPPICEFRVEVSAIDSSLTRGLGKSFVVEDEPYFVELQDPGSTQILLTADYGPSAVSPAIGTLYPSDTSLQPDGRTRVLGYTVRSAMAASPISLSAIATTPPSAPPGPPTRRTRRRRPFTARGKPTRSLHCCATPSPGACAPDHERRVFWGMPVRRFEMQLILYYAPNACSLVPYVTLTEAGAAFEVHPLNFRKSQHMTPEYLRLNPKHKVPVLVIDGAPLTENVAIQLWIARHYPAARLLPADPMQELHAVSLLAWCASGIHPFLSRINSPPRVCDLPGAEESVRRLAQQQLFENYQIADDKLADREWFFDHFTAVDAHFFWCFRRGTQFNLDVSQFKNSICVRCSRLLARMAPIAAGEPTANTKAAQTVSLSAWVRLLRQSFSDSPADSSLSEIGCVSFLMVSSQCATQKPRLLNMKRQ